MRRVVALVFVLLLAGCATNGAAAAKKAELAAATTLNTLTPLAEATDATYKSLCTARKLSVEQCNGWLAFLTELKLIVPALKAEHEKLRAGGKGQEIKPAVDALQARLAGYQLAGESKKGGQ